MLNASRYSDNAPATYSFVGYEEVAAIFFVPEESRQAQIQFHLQLIPPCVVFCLLLEIL